MKRLLLILLIGILSLSACGAPTTAPEAETTPATPPAEQPSEQVATEPEPEPQEAPDYTNWIAAELKRLNQAIIQFTGNTNKYIIWTWVWDEEEETYKPVGQVEGGEEKEKVLVHEFQVFAGGGWYLPMIMPASALHDAWTHINNAYWLTNKSRLPNEAMERDVSTHEIVQEVSGALTLLEWQVSSSYSWQEGQTEYIREYTGQKMPVAFGLQFDEEFTIYNLNKICDEYREELAKLIPKLELILSRLPEE